MVTERAHSPRRPLPGQTLLSRRAALRLGLAGISATALLAGTTGAASAAPPRPVGRGYVRYEDVYVLGDDLQDVANRVTGGRILTLPCGYFTVRDFQNGYYDGVRLGTGDASGCSGLVGSGPDTIVCVEANTATRDRGHRFAGNQLTIADTEGAVLSNFTLKGYEQNGMIYSGITVSHCPDAQLSWLVLRGASRGYAQHPPGETFGINVLRSPRVTISDSEVDGRDDSGTRVIASPIGWNNTTDAKLYRTYCHHGRAGMLTFYQVTDIYTEDYRCFATSSGQGELSGHGINHEQSQGTITHVRPSLFINGRYSRSPGASESGGMHINLANTQQDLTDVMIWEPSWDSGPGSTGMFAVNIPAAYEVDGETNEVTTAPSVIKRGVVLQPSDHPQHGYGDKDPHRFFSVIH